MAEFSCLTNEIENLPIINLDKGNIESEWSCLISWLNDCTFLALDIVILFCHQFRKI